MDALHPRLLTATWATLLAGGGQHGQPLGLRSVKYSHDVLRQALQAAVDEGLLAVSPGDAARPRVAPDASVEEPLRVWTVELAARFPTAPRGHPYDLVWT